MIENQTMGFIILAIICTIGYFGTATSDDKRARFYYIIIWALATGFLFVICIVETQMLNKCNKCPEYEKVENVYRIK